MPDDRANFAYSTVATAPSPAASGTSLVVASGTGGRFPTPPFNVTIWPESALALPTNAEIARVTAVATDTLTITRAQESSTARAIVVGDQLAATITDKVLTDLETIFARDTSMAEVVNSNTETTVFSTAIPGGTLGTNGLLRVWLLADILNNQAGGGTAYLRLKYGGTVMGVVAPSTAQNANRYAVTAFGEIVAANATNVQVGVLWVVQGAAGSAAAPAPVVGTGTTTPHAPSVNNAAVIDSTVAQNLEITFQFIVANANLSFRLHAVHVLQG